MYLVYNIQKYYNLIKQVGKNCSDAFNETKLKGVEK